MNIAKTALAVIIMTAAGPNLSAAGPKDRSCDLLPMDTYIWHGSMKDSTYVQRIDFDNFDTVFLMDKSMWNSTEEFDGMIDSLLADPTAIIPISKRDLFSLAADSAHAAGTKAVLSIGNELLHSSLDDQRLAKSCRAIAQTVGVMDLDGIDIDWEIGIYNHLDRHSKLLVSLRHSLDSLSHVTGKQYTLSTALSVEAQMPDWYISTIRDAVDYINLMAYDIGGCLWRNYASHNTGLALIASCIENYWKEMPRHKLHLGLASYGFRYNGILPDEKMPEGHNIGEVGSYVDYNAMLNQLYSPSAWRRQYDPDEKMNYFIDDSTHSFITMETPETIALKFDFAVEAGLGGTFWWEYAKDVVPDNNWSDKWHHTLIPDHRQIAVGKR